MLISRASLIAFLVVTIGTFAGMTHANEFDYLFDGDFDKLEVGTGPDQNSPAGEWYIGTIPAHPEDTEDDPTQVSVVPTSTFVPGADGNSLQIDYSRSLSNATLVLHEFEDVIEQAPGQIVRANFDVFVPATESSQRGGILLAIGGDNSGWAAEKSTDRGPQIDLDSRGRLSVLECGGNDCKQFDQQTVLSETPVDVWQHFQFDIDLESDTYDLFWSAGDDPLEPIQGGVGFRSGTQDFLDHFMVLVADDHPSRPVGLSYLDNINIEVLQKTPGDSNFDGEIDATDFQVLAGNFGSRNATWSQGDFDGNGTVGLADVMLLSESISDGEKAELAILFGAPQTAALTVGQTYSQDFNSMAMDGASGSTFPTAWSVTDQHGAVRRGEAGVDFPTSVRAVEAAGAFAALNAGATEGDVAADRSLAIYKPAGGQEDPVAIQLLTETEGTAGALQLAFSVEGWDRGRGTTENRDGGEAKFNVSIEIDSGEESDFSSITGGSFTELLNLGTVTTGADLPRPSGFLDGNDPEHRVSFASEVLHADIPAGSRLRFRWETTEDADASDSWVFGIDDVSITLVAAGDTDANGEVNFLDFLALAENFGEAGGWAQGDFSGNGEVDFLDFLALAENFGQSVTAAAAVPEPTASLMAVFGVLGLIGFRKRR